MEPHLGMATRNLGIHIATPVFDERSSEKDLWDTVKEASMDSDARPFFTMDVQVSHLFLSCLCRCHVHE